MVIPSQIVQFNRFERPQERQRLEEIWHNRCFFLLCAPLVFLMDITFVEPIRLSSPLQMFHGSMPIWLLHILFTSWMSSVFRFYLSMKLSNTRDELWNRNIKHRYTMKTITPPVFNLVYKWESGISVLHSNRMWEPRLVYISSGAIAATGWINTRQWEKQMNLWPFYGFNFSLPMQNV